MRPAGVLVISFLERVWGPDHSDTVGDSRLEALKKAKNPTQRAALIGEV